MTKMLKRQRLHNDREAEMSVTQWFQSQAADLYDTGIRKLVKTSTRKLTRAEIEPVPVGNGVTPRLQRWPLSQTPSTTSI